MKKYMHPEMEIEKFFVEDIITASGDEDPATDPEETERG